MNTCTGCGPAPGAPALASATLATATHASRFITRGNPATNSRPTVFHAPSQRLVAHRANAHFAAPHCVDRGTQAQEVAGDVVVIAGDFHLHGILRPCLSVSAGVNRHDVPQILDANLQPTSAAIGPPADAL